MAQEELGLVEWSNCAGEIPTTAANMPLAQLDITNPAHPLLKRAPPGAGSLKSSEASNEKGHEEKTSEKRIDIFVSSPASDERQMQKPKLG
jgi:hypothetical protein